MTNVTKRQRAVFAVGLLLAAAAGNPLRSQTTSGSVDLGPWPKGASPQEIGKRVAENFLTRTNMLTPQDGTIHYSQVCTWYGALTFAQLTADKPLEAALVKRYHDLMLPANEKIIPNREHVDWSVFGVLPLQIYLQTGDANALAFGKAKADKQWENPREDGLSPQTRFWIDDMYMISSLQAQAFRSTGDKVYLDRAAKEMVIYLDKLQQTNAVLSRRSREIFLGPRQRLDGRGMTELLRDLPEKHAERARIMEGYRKMMAALLKSQDANGMWHQLVDYPEAWPRPRALACSRSP